MKHLTFILLIFLLASCRHPAKVNFSSAKDTENGYFSGWYSAMGIRLTPAANSDSVLSRKLLTEVFNHKFVFDFRTKDSVFLNPDFGMMFFGDSAFKCSVSNKSILLSNGEKKFTIPFSDENEICELFLNTNGVEKISIGPSKHH
jgi:hypothetical protein